LETSRLTLNLRGFAMALISAGDLPGLPPCSGHQGGRHGSWAALAGGGSVQCKPPLSGIILESPADFCYQAKRLSAILLAEKR
jgi:hypothetical protein